MTSHQYMVLIISGFLCTAFNYSAFNGVRCKDEKHKDAHKTEKGSYSQCVDQSVDHLFVCELIRTEQQLKLWHHPSTQWKMQQRREGREGGCCFGVIAAITGLAGGTGDVTHLQAALLSFELSLGDGGRDGLGESCVVLNVQHLEDDCRFWINAKELFFFFLWTESEQCWKCAGSTCRCKETERDVNRKSCRFQFSALRVDFRNQGDNQRRKIRAQLETCSPELFCFGDDVSFFEAGSEHSAVGRWWWDPEFQSRICVSFHLWSAVEVGEGLEADMERDEGGRAKAEPVRGRDKILCYINMKSPGRSSDLDLELLEEANTWGQLAQNWRDGCVDPADCPTQFAKFCFDQILF